MRKITVWLITLILIINVSGMAYANPQNVNCNKLKPASKIAMVNCDALSQNKKRSIEVDTKNFISNKIGFNLSLEDKIKKIIDWAAKKVKIRQDILEAVAKQESGGNQQKVSPAGAVGIMQLMPNTAKSLGFNPFDEQQNILCGAEYLKQQIDRFQGNLPMALAAYNAGPEAVDKFGGVPPFKETQDYINKVLSNMR